MSRSPRLLVLLLSASLLGCTSDEPGTDTAYGDIVLTEEEQAELDAFLDSARTAAAEASLARSEGAYGGPPAGAGPLPGEGPAPDATAGSERRGWPEPEALRYRRYQNEAYGYGFEYPDNLFDPDEPIGGNRGHAFQTADGSAILLVFATDGGPDALRREYEAEVERFDQEVSYRVLRPNWFVVSGHQGPHIFYQRTHRSADGGLRTFRLRHLARDKDFFGPITERLSHSFEG